MPDTLAQIIGTPPPPHPAISPTTELVFTWTLAVVVALVVLAVGLHCYRARNPIGLLILAGGAAATIQEPMVDTLGNMYIPPATHTALTTFGRGMPVWVVLAYTIYFGLFALVYYTAATRNAGKRTFQALFLGSLILEIAFDGLFVNTDFYFYYGEQPFRIAELPLHWITLNMSAAWVAAAAVYAARRHLHGVRVLVVPFIVISAVSASYIASGWPIFSALHAENPSATLTRPASLLTVALGLGVIWSCISVLSSNTGTTGNRTAGTLDSRDAD